MSLPIAPIIAGHYRHITSGAVPPPTTPNPPVADFEVVGPTSGYRPFTARFRDKSTGIIASRAWVFGDGTNVRDTSPEIEHTYVTLGLLSPRLQVHNAGGSDTFILTNGIEVLAPPTPPVAGFTTDPDPATGAAPFTLTSITNTSTGTNLTYEWDIDGVVFSTAETPTVIPTFNEVRVYQLRLTVTDEASQQDAYTLDITVTAPTQPPGGTAIPFTQFNPSTASLASYPVGAWVSFAESENFLGTSTFQVLDASDTPIASQFKVLSRWHGLRDDPTKPLKSIRAYFKGTQAGGSPSAPVATSFKLQTDAQSQSTGSLIVADVGSQFIITSGTDLFRIQKNALTLLDAAIVDGTSVLDGAGALDFALNTGAIAPTNIVTTLETGSLTSGNVVVVIRQEGHLGPDLRYIARWTFRDGTKDVEFEHQIRNRLPYTPSINNTDVNTRWIDRWQFELPIETAGGALSVRSANGTFAVASGSHYWLHQRIRQPASQTDRRFDSSQPGTGLGRHDHILSYKEGVDVQLTNYDDARYDSSVDVRGENGGVTACIDHFYERAPNSIEALNGKLRLGFMPADIPGDPHMRPWVFRDQSNGAPWFSGVPSPEGFPAGQNTAASPPRPWANGDYAPPGYPDGDAPPVNPNQPTEPGTQNNQAVGMYVWSAAQQQWVRTAQPRHKVRDLCRTHYRLEGGRAIAHRVVLRFGAGTSHPTTQQLADFASMVRNPSIGITSARRYHQTKPWGPQPWLDRIPAAQDFDVARHMRFYDILVNDQAADIGSQSPVRAGHNAWMEHAGRVGQQMNARTWGKDAFGDIVNADNYSNNSYDTPEWLIKALIFTQDARALYWARAHGRYARDLGHIHCDYTTSLPAGDSSGLAYYEKGIWHGNGANPDWGHTWVLGRLLLYLLMGDEFARESVMFTMNAATAQRNYRAPDYWEGEAEARQWARAMNALTQTYNVLGPVVSPGPGRNILDVARAGMQNWLAHEQGTRNGSASWNGGSSKPCNLVKAQYTLAGQDMDCSNNGYVLWNTPNYATTHQNHCHPWHNMCQPWMQVLAFVAAMEFMWSDPDRNDALPPYSDWYGMIKRSRNWIRTGASTLAPGGANFPQVVEFWRPDGVHAGANPVTGAPTWGSTWRGSNVNAFYIAGVMAYYAIFFKGTADELTGADGDLERAKKYFRHLVRWHQWIAPHSVALTVPNKGTYFVAPSTQAPAGYPGDVGPESPLVYVQSGAGAGQPVPSAQLHGVNLYWLNHSQAIVHKTLLAAIMTHGVPVAGARYELGDGLDPES